MSTYSPSLRIELITTGDQAGTWGTTTNTNMGTLIESAIAGYTSVSITSGNQALTALNGAADQSRNMTIALTTTTGANFNVYAPPAEKTYVIYNASSYTATVYNSTVLGNTTAAGTGVAIPANKTMTIWSDGTNFRVQNDHLSSLTLTSALPVTSGGTGVTTATGTGSVVLSASPALTGAPTAPTASPGTNTTQVANTAFVQAALQAVYPVGSVYINAASTTNPATLLGFGTWTEIGAGQVLIGQNGADPAFDTLGETGGSTTTSSTTPSMSASTTNLSVPTSGYSVAGGFPGTSPWGYMLTGNGQTEIREVLESVGWTDGSDRSIGGHTHSISGGAHTHTITPPYIVVKMWKRTA